MRDSKKIFCFCLLDEASVSLGARIKRSGTTKTRTTRDLSDFFSKGIDLIGAIVPKIAPDLGLGSELSENIGILVKLVGKLVENTAFRAKSSDSSFKLRRLPIYGLIFKVQNEQNMLAEPGVEPIQMKQSEFLDAKHIMSVLFVCHKTSDMISDLYLSLICLIYFWFF